MSVGYDEWNRRRKGAQSRDLLGVLGKLFNLCIGVKFLRRNLCCLKLSASFVVTPLTTASVDVLTAAKQSVVSAASATGLPQVDNRGHYSSFRFKLQKVVDAIC